MNKRYGTLIVSVTILVLCFVGAASAANWTVDGSGGADFTGIQDAINNASDGDTILVHSGVYHENVVVDKSVTLRGVGHPVVDAGGKRHAITLAADGIKLVGFTATNASSYRHAGIMVTSKNNTITGNNASNNNGDGICLASSSNNTITGNVFVNDGLSVDSSYQNTVEGNIANGKPLVYLEGVSDYKVEDAGQVIIVNCTTI
jgi:parallel beta-helix repeat protein